MFTTQHSPVRPHKGVSKTLLVLAILLALLLSANWWEGAEEPRSEAPDPAQHALAVHMGNFDWTAAMRAVSQR